MALLFNLLICTLPLFINAKIFYTDKDNEQSIPLPMNSDRIKVFQEKILAILGLQRPNPNQTHNPADEFASKFMSALYELMTEKEKFVSLDNEIGHVLNDIGKESQSADTVVSFVPQIRPSDESFDLMYEATFSSIKNISSGQLIAVRMFVVLENVPPLVNSTKLRVYRKAIGAELVEVGSRKLSSYGQVALVSLNVTQLVDGWLNNEQPFPTQQTIYLELNGPNDKPHEIERRMKRSLSDLDETTEKPLTTTSMKSDNLSTTTTIPPILRSNKLAVSKDKRCGLRSLFVDFKDLGWSDWVIAPQGYYADYCSGECGFPLDNTVTPINHAIVQNLVHMLDKRRASTPKCAPAELSSQSILFLNTEKNLVMKNYKNMRAISCGCR